MILLRMSSVYGMPVLYLRYQTMNKTEILRRLALTRCHNRAMVIVKSQMAADTRQTITTD